MEIKVCGITNIDDAAAAVECGADALGFIFHQPSPRYIKPEAARAIIGAVPGACKVGVFVNLEQGRVKEIVQYCGLDLVQLHGDEPPGYCRLFPAAKLIKAVSPRSAEDLAGLDDFEVRSFLVDSRRRGLYGGTGEACDWRLAALIAQRKSLILSGGLGPDNLRDAIMQVAPRAVDLNSGIEAAPGVKDHEKMRAALDRVRAMDSSHFYPEQIFRKKFNEKNA